MSATRTAQMPAAAVTELLAAKGLDSWAKTIARGIMQRVERRAHDLVMRRAPRPSARPRGGTESELRPVMSHTPRRLQPMTTAPDAAKVWDVLVRESDARSDDLGQFIVHWPDCREYRFMGSLGFGGKVWWSGGRVYVNCYREDETPARLATIERTNAALAAL